MTKRLIPATLFLALTLGGCATQNQLPVPDNVKILENQFIFSRDDSATRLGTNATYVLIEKKSDKSWAILSMSKQKIRITRSNQEELLVSRNYSNVVPTWNWGSGTTYKEDPVTGKRSNFVFSHSSPGKLKDYGPANSAFASIVSSTNMPTLSGAWGAENYYRLNTGNLNQALVATNLLEETRSFNAGQKMYPSQVAEVIPLKMKEQVWKIEMNGAGETGRYFFVPSKLITQNDEYIEEGSRLRLGYYFSKYENNFAPFEDLKRIKVYSKFFRENVACYDFLLDVGAYLNVRESTCSIANGRMPLRVDSKTLGNFISIDIVEGTAYGFKGDTKGRNWPLKLDLSQISQLWILDANEAQAARATFR